MPPHPKLLIKLSRHTTNMLTKWQDRARIRLTTPSLTIIRQHDFPTPLLFLLLGGVLRMLGKTRKKEMTVRKKSMSVSAVCYSAGEEKV